MEALYKEEENLPKEEEALLKKEETLPIEAEALSNSTHAHEDYKELHMSRQTGPNLSVHEKACSGSYIT